MIKRGLTTTVSSVFPWIELILFVLLVAIGFWMVKSRPWGLDASSAATLTGAMWGGGALLLGNGINRLVELGRSNAETQQRVEKIKVLVAAELVDVAIGLVEAKKLMEAAVTSFRAGGSVPPISDLSSYRPRALSLTESLGADLLVLDSSAVDALAMLRANLTITRQAMDGMTHGGAFGLLSATRLANGLGHDLDVLSRTIELVAPDRKLQMQGQEPRLLVELLREAANASPDQTP